MTDEELTDIEKMLNEYENNGFLKSVYSSPSKINLNAVLHSYFVKKGEIDVDTLSKEEVENVKKQFNVEEFEIPLFKITTSELLEYYKEKTGDNRKEVCDSVEDAMKKLDELCTGNDFHRGDISRINSVRRILRELKKELLATLS